MSTTIYALPTADSVTSADFVEIDQDDGLGGRRSRKTNLLTIRGGAPISGVGNVGSELKGIYFDGFNNTTPVAHSLGSSIYLHRTKPICMAFSFVCPTAGDVRNNALGRGLGGISASATACDNSSFGVYLKGTTTGLGSLTVRFVNAAGGDYEVTVPNFCQTYGGQRVSVLVVRIETILYVYVNGVLVLEDDDGNWYFTLGTPGTTAFYWIYGYYNSTLGGAFLGRIYEAAIGNVPFDEDEASDFYVSGYDETMLRADSRWCIGNNDPTNENPGVDGSMSTFVGFNWHDYNEDAGHTYTDSGAVVRTSEDGSATSWNVGEVDPALYTSKLYLKAKASSGVNSAYCSFSSGPSAVGYRHCAWIDARYLGAGTSPVLTIGTATYNNDDGAGDAFELTPTNEEATYFGYFIRHATGTLKLSMLNTADSAAQEFTFDNCKVLQVGFYCMPNLGYGCGWQVPDLSAAAAHAVVPTSGASWVAPKQSGVYKQTTSTNGSVWLGDGTERAVIPANSRIRSVRARSTGTPAILLGTTNGGNEVVASVSLVANTWTDLTLVARIITAGKLSATANSTSPVEWVIDYDA